MITKLDLIVANEYTRIAKILLKQKLINYAPRLRTTEDSTYIGQSEIIMEGGKVKENTLIKISTYNPVWIENLLILQDTICHELAHNFYKDCTGKRHKIKVQQFKEFI